MSTLPELWEHQKKTIALAKDLPSFGLLHDAGVGKTRTMIEILRYKCAKAGKLLRTLVLCPQVVMPNWRAEISKYSKIDPDDVILLKGSGQERYELLLNESGEERRRKIFVANYESLLMPNLFEAFNWYGFDIIIADESHRIKSHTSKRAKYAIKLANKVLHKYILTGTPILQSPLDLFSQFQFLDGGKTFAPVGDNFFAFRNTYFINKNANAPSHVTWPEWVIRPGALNEISEKIGKISTHVKKSECLDLPNMVRKTIYVELGKDQRKHYEQMKHSFVTFLGEKACTAQLAVTKGLRLQQIASGFITLEDGTNVHMKEDPRAKALEDLLEDLVIEGKHKTIIWACWKENYVQIKTVLEKMKISYVEVHGEISQKEKQEAIDKFCNDSTTMVFLGNQGAAGIGINLVQASYAIYYSRNFNLEHDIQSEARNYRGGSEIHPCITRIDIVAQNTIDEKVLESLASKMQVGDKLLRNIAKEL
jgi:SNF2 family DNA or RNA helicase